MENEEKLYHRHLVRIDDELDQKLMNHIEVYDMTIAGVIRQSLRKYFENEELKKQTDDNGKKEMPME